MKQCQFCKTNFTNESAYQIHLGVGAPAFHPCNSAEEMLAKGMKQNSDGIYSIDDKLIIKRDNWAYLAKDIAS
jgi:hypothetical protein